MGITLADLAKRQMPPFEKGTVKIFLKEFAPAEELPIVTKSSLNVMWRQELSLPTMETRLLNEPWTDYSTGHFEERSMALPIYGGALRIDKQMLSEPGGSEEWAEQQQLKVRAMAYKLASDFLVGDTAVDPRSQDGLKVWRTKFPSRYTVDASSLDLNDATNRATNARQLIMYMKEAMLRVEEATGGLPNLIILNFGLYQIIADAMLASGYYNQNRDSYERFVDRFMGARIVRMGYGAPTGAGGQTSQTELLTNDHDSTGNTSMYFLRTGDQYCHLVQKHALKVTALPLQQGIFEEKIIEWPVAFRCKTPGALAAIKNLLVA